MKRFLLVAVVLSVSGIANAATYTCGTLLNSQNRALLGDHDYAVEIGANSVVLDSTFLAPGQEQKPLRTPMEKIHQGVENAVYQAGDATVVIATTPIGGKLVTSVTLRLDVAGDTYTASCNK